jgi:hypothetical protein
MPWTDDVPVLNGLGATVILPDISTLPVARMMRPLGTVKAPVTVKF